MINFWSRILCGDHNKLTYLTYSLCKHRYDSGQPTSEWFSNIVSLLNDYGIHSIPESIDDVKATVKQIHSAMHLEYVSKWEEQVVTSAKCSSLYKHVKSVFEREHYLTKLPFNLRLALSRIRTSNHKLPIEVGRYECVPREERICPKCESGQVGDEFHFLLTCGNPELVVLRGKYISPYYTINPSMEKLNDLLNNKGRKIFKLARYVEEGLKLY